MTEIHERLQPVAEVGENGSNGEEESFKVEQEIIPLGTYYLMYWHIFSI